MHRLRYRGPDFDTAGVRVRRFEVKPEAEQNLDEFLLHLHYAGVGRECEPGLYARLDVDGKLWMSDTTAERRDHLMPVAMADMHPNGRGLVNGLGLGCVVGAMLDVLEHVDVVEIDPRIQVTIGRWLKNTYGDRVDVWLGDAYAIAWPKGMRWDVVWHDIWPELSSSNLAGMTTLHRRYGSRCDWQGSWGQQFCRWMRDEEEDLYQRAVAAGYRGPRP
jgi:hypothetical protein